MQERKETISITKANWLSLALFLVAASVGLGIFFSVWDIHDYMHLSILEPALDHFIQRGVWVFLLLLLLGILVHELIHGLAWACFAPSRFKSISFGVKWKDLTPYCHCSEPLLKHQYVIGALMPLIVLGIVPVVWGICIHSLIVLLYGVTFISSAAGDIMVVWRLRKEHSLSKVLDHPNEPGYFVYEAD